MGSGGSSAKAAEEAERKAAIEEANAMLTEGPAMLRKKKGWVCDH